MAKLNPYEKILENKVFTATKEELTLMLYEGALKFCNQAILAIENKELEKANTLLQKAQNIIIELQITLDKKYPISNDLNIMYDYIIRLLTAANIKKDVVPLIEARDLIRDFRDTWKDAMSLAKSEGKSHTSSDLKI
jgi:flagellar secretion chaperone FliS